jgi:6-phosphogluconolactonase
VHRVRGELGGESAATDYDRELEGVTLGLALQGLGPDGHTASLFPGAPALEERERRAIAVPHDDVERVTMTLPMLSAAAQVVFLVIGAEKTEAVARAFGSTPDPATPASLLRSAEGETIVLLDRAAAANLDNVS